MSIKNFFNSIFTLRRLFLLGNIILLVLFMLAIAQDQHRGWTSYQKEFKSREIARLKEKVSAAANDVDRAHASDELRVAKRTPIEIRQQWAQDLNAVDRCITCHVGYDTLSNPAMTTEYKDQPYRAPADTAGFEIHKAHNIEKMGCTVCHGGQGLATEVEAAHGHVEHWETPLLTGTLIQSSCEKCHDNLSELTVHGQVYPAEILRAKKLFKDSGCIGCHQVGGEGGPISVDLKEETSAKPLTRIDFSHTGLKKEDWTLANWIKVHFVKDPVGIQPGDPEGKFNTEPIAPSAMPPYLLSDKDADALTAYILGLNRNVPLQYLTLRATEAPPVGDTPVQRGRIVYEKYGCAACHGSDARGGIRNYNYQYDVTPNLRRVVATYTREEIKEKISEGVAFVAKHDPKGPTPPLYMPSWKAKIKGQELDDLVSYLQSVQE